MNKLHVYTGDGKGKTTAAMGLALRSLGHGNRVLIAQFMKKGNSGELKALAAFENAKILTAPPVSGFTFRMTAEEKEKARQEQTRFAGEALGAIASFRPQMIILDELGIALSLGMAAPEAGEALISAALQAGETVVTGRAVPEELLRQADYVSRITAEKHPYETEHLPARKGVEW